MKLSPKELEAMNQEFWMKRLENVPFKTFKAWGLANETNKDILEIGCGSGTGALLLSQLKPKSYYGIDLMEEQIERAIERTSKRDLVGYKFKVMDATDLSLFQDKSKDVIVIFAILHHIPEWRHVLSECHRVLKKGGKIFVEEPHKAWVMTHDFFTKWGHDPKALFGFKAFRQGLQDAGFTLRAQKLNPLWGKWFAVK